MPKAPDTIVELVKRFDEHIDAYKSGGYNETQLRQEFLNPFFEALGWDVYNKKGYAEPYKDVIHEDAISVGAATKAPDYCFRIGGTRKFFVEAKKPSVNLKDDISPAFQLRRYAWSSKLPLSILTDFEEFAIYECATKPEKTDKASKGRVLYLKYDEYPDRWDEIHAVFARDAILKGSFDKYAESKKLKRGTAEVDDEFLKEIEAWRELLAKNIALRNTALTQRELNYAVQQTIDRIVFLRIAEDRGIETYGRLQSLLNGTNCYRRMVQLFQEADDRYNSGLFHFTKEKDRTSQPDELTPRLAIDDKAIKDILKRLYYPESPYEFSVLPADILGQVYERFLGRVIRLTKGHYAKVEDKPEVRKAGGVYYTPTYIVDYIVKNTVGKLVEGKTPKQVSTLRVLDPACGSGSFLIGAYRYLLDWHRDWYAGNDPDKWAGGKTPAIYQAQSGEWQLTTAEKKRILLNNIYGVDIDPQAVEVSKLSLLLKVLEGESGQTLKAQLKMFQERALPDLSGNIKCGNSLIGPDFYEGKALALFDEEEQYRINVFDWQAEFKDIMKSGGFDAVIGNPPYVRQEMLKEYKDYFKQAYHAYHGTADLYTYFIERGLLLLEKGGLFGYITSNKFMRTNYGNALRDLIISRTKIREIVDFGELPVFQGAATFPSIILLENIKTQKQSFVYVPIKRLDFASLDTEVTEFGNTLDNYALDGSNWTLTTRATTDILKKMREAGQPLGEHINNEIYYGIKTGLNNAFIIDKEIRKILIAEDPKCAALIKPFILGDDIRKYRVNYKGKHIILIPKGWTDKNNKGKSSAWQWFTTNYPSIAEHLSQYREKAEKRYDKGDYWWELRACDYYHLFEKPKIIYPDIAKESRATLDADGYHLGNTAYFIPSDDKYLLGILNSKLIFSYYKRVAAVLGDADKGGRLRWFTQDVLNLPIRTIDFSKPKEKKAHDKMVSLVERMLDLNKRLQDAKTAHEQTALKRQIESTDKQIDALVYELYGLTDEEIKIVEGKSG